MATTVTAVTLPAAAEIASTPIILFSDNFDSGYTDNRISKHIGNDYSCLTGNVFETSSTINIAESENYLRENMEKKGDADNVFVLKDNAGVGSNKALNVTTQAGLNSCSWMVKNSGITSDTINGKALTFIADFMIPDDNGFNKGNGVFVYLDELGDDNKPTTNTSFGEGLSYAHYENDSNKDGAAMWKKTLLGIESYNWWTSNPCIIAFGEKVQNIEAGKAYSYKLTLTPNAEGKYTAKASVNGTEYVLAGTNLPTVEEMSAYKFAMIAEKANPYNINASCKKDNKYQNDKTIVLLDNLSLTAAAPVFESDILFSDDFSDYTGEYIEKAEANELSYYNTDKYILHNWQSSVSYPNGESNAYIPASKNPSNIAKLADNVLGASNGKALQLTSQGIIKYGSMYRKSNITADKINDKALVFNAKFKIPEDGMYNGGVGFAAGLSPVNKDNTAPDAVCGSENLTLAQGIGNKYKFFAANGFDFYVFGKKIDTLKKGKTYDFTLKMIPDTDNSGYKIYAKLNDYEVEVLSDDVPAAEEIKTYKYSYIAIHNHGWYTYAGSKNADGTSSYESDKPLVYIDGISLESKDESEITVPKSVNIEEYRLFEDDFSGYGSEGDYIKKADSDTIEAYEDDEFILNYNAWSSASNKETYPDVVASGNVERAAKVSEESGFGRGKSLKLQSQGILSNASMWKKSNITYEKIKDKTLVFKTEFMIPSDGIWNKGTVAAITFSGKSANKPGQPDAALRSVDFLLNNLNPKYMLAGVGYCDYKRQLQVFGENVSEIKDDKIYNLTVTMTPDANGKYSVRVKLNDFSKILAGTGAPTADEVGGYAYAGIINHSHSWHTSTAFSQDNPYRNDEDLIYIDNISLNAEPTFYVSKNGNNLNDGSAAAPFKTIERALSEARSGINTIIVAEDDANIETVPELQGGGITLRGKTSTVKINLSNNFECRSDIVFDNLELNGSTVFANGYKLETTDSVTSTNRMTVYGGGNGNAVTGDTNISLYGGKYNRVYGGSLNAAVNGNTNVIFGGNCNTGDGIDDSKASVSPCYVYGGGNNGSVSEKTNVTLGGNAVTKYIAGGGSGSGGLVGKSTNINIAGGKVMNVYAGSAGSAPTLNCDTNITMTGGLAESLFGGSEGTNLTGNAHLYLLGGEVTRRVFSGCYNGTSGWFFIRIASSNHIKGTTTIVIDNDAKLITKNGLSSSNQMNSGIFAGSRISSKNAEEVNTIIFLNDSYDSKKSLIGDKSGWSDTFKSFETYTIKAGKGGSADTIGSGVISLKPDAGMAAQIGGKTYGSESINVSTGTTEVKFVGQGS